MSEWETIVDFAPIADADDRWQRWLLAHDVRTLGEDDILIDTGRGHEEADVRRYRIRQAAMKHIKPLPQGTRDA